MSFWCCDVCEKGHFCKGFSKFTKNFVFSCMAYLPLNRNFDNYSRRGNLCLDSPKTTLLILILNKDDAFQPNLYHPRTYITFLKWTFHCYCSLIHPNRLSVFENDRKNIQIQFFVLSNKISINKKHKLNKMPRINDSFSTVKISTKPFESEERKIKKKIL